MECQHNPTCESVGQHEKRLDFRSKLLGLQFQGAGEKAIETRQRDRKFENVDGPAYQRLKADGIQPNNVDGAHLLEQNMTHPLEAAMGTNLFPWEKKAMAREGMA